MNGWTYVLGYWLLDLYALATIVLAIAAACVLWLRQPARRLVVAWAAHVGVTGVTLLSLVPGWPRIGPNRAAIPVERGPHLAASDLNIALPSHERGDRHESLGDGASGTAVTWTDAHPTRHVEHMAAGRPPARRATETVARSSDQRSPSGAALTGELLRVLVACFATAAGLLFAWTLLGAWLARRLARQTEPASVALQAALRAADLVNRSLIPSSSGVLARARVRAASGQRVSAPSYRVTARLSLRWGNKRPICGGAILASPRTAHPRGAAADRAVTA